MKVIGLLSIAGVFLFTACATMQKPEVEVLKEEPQNKQNNCQGPAGSSKRAQKKISHSPIYQ